MPGESGKKLFVGPRFRRIRQQLGLSQTQIAEGLGISPSYINLIERNQRPLTVQLLLKLSEVYAVDLAGLKASGEAQATLTELKADGTLAEISRKWFDTDITTPAAQAAAQ